MPHEARRVAQDRAADLRRRARPQLAEQRRVRGEAPGDRHELVRVVRDGLFQADALQYRVRGALAVRVADQRDHRHAHPERLARRRRAVVGNRVERQVDVVVPVEMARRVGDMVGEQQALRRDAEPAELLDQVGAHGGAARAARLDHQPGGGDGAQRRRPQRERAAREFRQGVERAERDVAVALRGRAGGARPLVECAEAQERLGKPQQLLEVQRVVVAVRVPVADPVVDERRAAGVGIAEVHHLERRRPRGERPQAAALGVAGEVDQDVDAVAADLLRERAVRQVVHRLEAIGVPPDRLGDVVAAAQVRVADDLEARLVVLRDEVAHEVADRVAAQVGRQVGEAQPAGAPCRDGGQRRRALRGAPAPGLVRREYFALGERVVVVERHQLVLLEPSARGFGAKQRPDRVQAVEIRGLLQHLRDARRERGRQAARVGAGLEHQAVRGLDVARFEQQRDQVAEADAIGGVPGERGPVCRGGAGQVAGILQRHAEVGVRRPVIGDPDRLAEALDRRGIVAPLQPLDAEVVQHLRVAAVERMGGAQMAGGLVEPSAAQADRAQRGERRRESRIDGERFAIALLGLRRAAARGLQQCAEVEAEHRIARIVGDRLPIRLHRLVVPAGRGERLRQVVVGVGELRIELERPAAMALRLFGAAEPRQHQAEVAVERGVVVDGLQQLLELAARLRPVAERHVRQAAQTDRFRVIGLPLAQGERQRQGIAIRAVRQRTARFLGEVGGVAGRGQRRRAVALLVLPAAAAGAGIVAARYHAAAIIFS
ncbi:MAG TPA: hypothetical protein VF211_15655 [Burkholderiales bacterium]